MGFIQDLSNNRTLEFSVAKSIGEFVKEKKEDIKGVFEEVNNNVKEDYQDASFIEQIIMPGKIAIESVFDTLTESDNAKKLVSDFGNNLKEDLTTWAKEETLIGDIVNYFNKDKNIEAEG